MVFNQCVSAYNVSNSSAQRGTKAGWSVVGYSVPKKAAQMDAKVLILMIPLNHLHIGPVR